MTNGVQNLLGAGSSNTPAPKDVASQVQGMFVEVMLKAMEESVDAEDGLFGNSMSSDMYRGMMRENLAKAISEKMNSPLEGVLDTALTRPSTTADEQHNTATPIIPASTLAPANLPVSGVISSPEGWRRDPIDGSTRYHAGTDIAAPTGTPIRAVADGRVIESGSKGSYGNAVVIQTEDGHKMLYAHNSKNFVQVGDWVSRGEPIAEVGSTGRATGPHVHFEVTF
jgi:murein DD-endopeptidase MepM/ murein hydrolase activator NlpD